ncbi:MAG: hypothetical protein ACOZAJ_01205 [Patescibacteria group bacterium]
MKDGSPYNPATCCISKVENCTIEGKDFQGIVKKIIYSSEAQSLTTNPTKGTILLAEITKGTVSLTNKAVEIFVDGTKIFDNMVRLEKNRTGILQASEGDNIGICLEKSRVKEFAQLLTS